MYVCVYMCAVVLVTEYEQLIKLDAIPALLQVVTLYSAFTPDDSEAPANWALAALTCFLTAVSPTYLAIMFEERMGRYMFAGAILGIFAGYLVMKRIVNIKV